MSQDKKGFDRTSFFAGTHDEVADWQRKQVASMPIKDRLESAGALTMRVYGLDPNRPMPPFDRTSFSMRKHENR